MYLTIFIKVVNKNHDKLYMIQRIIDKFIILDSFREKQIVIQT